MHNTIQGGSKPHAPWRDLGGSEHGKETKVEPAVHPSWAWLQGMLRDESLASAPSGHVALGGLQRMKEHGQRGEIACTVRRDCAFSHNWTGWGERSARRTAFVIGGWGS